ncbi:crossover junction endodeoxyribonuclease RuvC [Sporomusa sp. KB1]|jgi:crossover junction endodeoxyribonuclease RuvC|uniref:crossover junction endodeoxyribonuclease RuvC n=1 Tax=Sporomusa sp. KB1 TaxID=943346 RepID=UPI0011A7FA80|nr:crossover junction endodeoxyribonuclease RuvC [Sporomusa sp. KB1]TWH48881.1 Holliday junction endonuclease RuvC [Sporomusa sp. KB1]
MIVLGIDPGTAICGYGLVEAQGSRLKPIIYGVIETTPDMEAAMRLRKVHQEIDGLIKQYQPDSMGVEMLFMNKNVRTVMAVGQARGVILLAAAQNELSIDEFTPLQVKQAVTGYGKATKEQVIYMTQRLLSLPKKPHPDDAADALAIAIATIHCGRSNRMRVTNDRLC